MAFAIVVSERMYENPVVREAVDRLKSLYPNNIHVKRGDEIIPFLQSQASLGKLRVAVVFSGESAAAAQFIDSLEKLARENPNLHINAVALYSSILPLSLPQGDRLSVFAHRMIEPDEIYKLIDGIVQKFLDEERATEKKKPGRIRIGDLPVEEGVEEKGQEVEKPADDTERKSPQPPAQAPKLRFPLGGLKIGSGKNETKPAQVIAPSRPSAEVKKPAPSAPEPIADDSVRQVAHVRQVVLSSSSILPVAVVYAPDTQDFRDALAEHIRGEIRRRNLGLLSQSNLVRSGEVAGRGYVVHLIPIGWGGLVVKFRAVAVILEAPNTMGYSVVDMIMNHPDLRYLVFVLHARHTESAIMEIKSRLDGLGIPIQLLKPDAFSSPDALARAITHKILDLFVLTNSEEV